MSKDLHTVSVMAIASALAMEDRLHFAHLVGQVVLGGNGTVTGIAAGTPGAGYAAIPTVALTVPASGAKSTGSGAAATALMGVVGVPTIAAAGSGGSNGAVTLTGTTGTGTKFQLTGTIAGGVLTAISAVSVIGSYSVLPTTLAAEPVTGGSLTGCTVNLAAVMGVIGYTVGTAGTHYPVGFVTASVSSGTPSTAAVPGVVTVTPAAGDTAAFDVVGSLPAAYAVQGTPSQDATVWVTSKTVAGFTVNVAPRLAANALAAGTIDLIVAG